MNFGHGRPRVGGMTKRCVRHFFVYKKSMSVRTWMLDTLHAKTEGTGSWRFDFTEQRLRRGKSCKWTTSCFRTFGHQ